jgi:ribosomal protein L37AE/L43A
METYRGTSPRRLLRGISGGIKMATLMKDKKHPYAGEIDDKTHQGESTEICEICGQKMERDPESGIFYCPDCDYSDE